MNRSPKPKESTTLQTAEPTWQRTLRNKHQAHMQMHCAAWGSPLGHLKTQPTQERLDADFEDRRARGELLSQHGEAPKPRPVRPAKKRRPATPPRQRQGGNE